MDWMTTWSLSEPVLRFCMGMGNSQSIDPCIYKSEVDANFTNSVLSFFQRASNL